MLAQTLYPYTCPCYTEIDGTFHSPLPLHLMIHIAPWQCGLSDHSDA